MARDLWRRLKNEGCHDRELGMRQPEDLVIPFSQLRASDVPRVGGKNASLGELISELHKAGVAVPDGFATTAYAYRLFMQENGFEQRISGKIRAWKKGQSSLRATGRAIRRLIAAGTFSSMLEEAIRNAYQDLCEGEGRPNLDVAVRSSATAEDLPEASFAGQLESYLNVTGAETVLTACRQCFASLFTDRALVYRETQGFDHLDVALSVGVQRMVRADQAGAGVMFSIDTETGFPDVVLINAAWGLGEYVVKGTVDPDEYMVFKPLLKRPLCWPIIGRTIGRKARKLLYSTGARSTHSQRTSNAERTATVLSDDEILQLARWAVAIEQHYGRAMDIEWAKDGADGGLYVVQARPETIQARREANVFTTYTLRRKGRQLLSGYSVGDAAATGTVCRLANPAERERFEDNAILVTAMTDPDWVPVMKRAAAIVTDHGGRTSHAAIVSRELGVPAVIGTGDATTVLSQGQGITVSCCEGEVGHVYEGQALIERQERSLDAIPETQTQIMLNLANPAAALRWWRLPSDGVGLVRMEFIISNLIKIHPMALARYETLRDSVARKQIHRLTKGYGSKADFFVEKLSEGIARIAAAHHPNPVIVRTSDFKTNEYARLIGGAQFEPQEENPMLGWRGASRYYSEGYKPGFVLECQALSKVRRGIGLENVVVMIPFCRTLEEADRTLDVMAQNGLKRGENGLEVYVMCEIPANVILAKSFAEYFDGFSIGSNDLTQLTLGVDRDSDLLAPLFDEENEAVTRSIGAVIEAAHVMNRKVGLCGQAPSDRPQFAQFLVAAGIDSISVSPDSFIAVKQQVAEAESKISRSSRTAVSSRLKSVS